VTLLERINGPEDLRELSQDQLAVLAAEIRDLGGRGGGQERRRNSPTDHIGRVSHGNQRHGNLRNAGVWPLPDRRLHQPRWPGSNAALDDLPASPFGNRRARNRSCLLWRELRPGLLPAAAPV